MKNDEQKYKEALARAREMCVTPTDKATMEYIFPELAESEDKDERIRRVIIEFLQAQNVLYDKINVEFTMKEAIAWLEKQGQTFTKKDVDDAYLKGVCDTKQELEKQGEQKQIWKPNAAQLIVIESLIEDKNTSKVNKVILRGMFEEFKQFTNSQSSQFSSEHLLDPDKVIEWIHKYWPFTRWDDITSTHDDAIEKFKKDFGL